MQMFLATAPCKVTVNASSLSLTHRNTSKDIQPPSEHCHPLKSIKSSICICDVTTLGFVYLICNMGLTTPTSEVSLLQGLKSVNIREEMRIMPGTQVSAM